MVKNNSDPFKYQYNNNRIIDVPLLREFKLIMYIWVGQSISSTKYLKYFLVLQVFK